ncbi:MAG: FAD-linked oxidase C-terminal domain-containing protein [Arenicellales bacterium]
MNKSQTIVSSIDQTLQRLSDVFGQRLKTGLATREQHGKDESFHAGHAPDAVIAVHQAKEVQQIIKICAEHNTPIIPWGQGTSLEGQVAALHGGICIDFSEMNQIIQVNAEDMDVVVQPGVTRRQLNEYLRDTGLFFPIDPGADASIGGMASTRASGTNAVRYGTMRENVLNITAVMANGELIKTAHRARKSSAGYDLTRLLVGAEGTLGVITELTLRLHGIPEAQASARCTFLSVGDAVNTVIETIQMGVPIARIELMDMLTVKAINAYSKLNLPEQTMLIMEFHGSEAGVKEQAETVQALAQENKGGDFTWATDASEQKALWRARHDAAYAIKALRTDGQLWATDACVPISRLAQCIDETMDDIKESNIISPILGHVGDGNFHLCMLVDHTKPAEVSNAEALHERMIKRAISMDGTCTGEHGIGYGKRAFLEYELGGAVDVMRSIKQALDPHNIMNPGKVV